MVPSDPDMVRSSKVALVYGSVSLSPFMELQEAVLLWHIRDTAEYWIA